MGSDQATVDLAGQLIGLGLDIRRGRQLAQAERDALLAAVRKAQAERVFTPTNDILGGGGEGGALPVTTPLAKGTPDESA